MRRIVGIAIVALAVCLIDETAIAECGEECDDVSAWARFTAIDLTVRSKGQKDGAHWLAEFDHSTGDFKIDIDTTTGSKPGRGTIGMIAGRTMIVKGVELERGYEIDALDGPVLTTRLMLAVLTRTVTGGPEALKGQRKIEYREPKLGIQFATPSASGHVTPPWHAVGTVERIPGDVVRYDLRLTGGTRDPLGNKGQPIDMRLTGALSMRSKPVFEDEMSLADWKVYGIGARTTPREGGQMLDFGATPNEGAHPLTVATVRAAIKEELSPGVADPGKNFTGMWKTKCEENFGLQIKPAGSEGMYSVSFCGPGGCFAPGEYRPNTFINGDRSYRVLSESEIEVRGANGFSAYRKCSSSPDPP